MKKVCHISATPNWKHDFANWGDKALVYAVQKVFNENIPSIHWNNLNCRKIYTHEDVNYLNTHDFIIVGGGGLILPDTFKNDVSGWQWGISAELLNDIKVPLIVYSIGWNLFDGQKNNDYLLHKNLITLNRKADFVSLRHNADVRIYNNFTQSDKGLLNFCPTIIMDEYKLNRSKNIGFNIAGDRLELRYKDLLKVYDNLLNTILTLKRKGYNPIIVNHMPLDEGFGKYIKQNIDIQMVDMATMTVEQGINFYRNLEYMFSTRGHAQMIPLGLGTKVVTLISHNKVKFFLDDINAQNTGVDINDEKLLDKCLEIMSRLNNYDFRCKRDIVEKNIKDNIIKIKELITPRQFTFDHFPFGDRYLNDGVPTLELNSIQRAMKRQITQKVNNGTYKFENVPCPVCKNGDFQKIAEKDRYGLYASTVICKKCGLIQMNPRMTQESYNQFYNVEYRKLYLGKHNVSINYFNRQYNRGKILYDTLSKIGLFEELPTKPYVLEVGCSAGGILKYFSDQKCNVKGIDLGEEYVKYGKEQFGLDLSIGTIQTVKLNVKPNLIIYTDCLEHILDVNKELEKVNDILAENGFIYIHVPGVHNLSVAYQSDILLYLQNAHVYHFSKVTLINLMKKYGFVPVFIDEKITGIFMRSSDIIVNDHNGAMNKIKKTMEYLPLKWKTNKTKKEESFILGSGRSLLNLNKDEVNHINNTDISISFNKFLLFYEKIGIIPKYHIQFDAHDDPAIIVYLKTIDKIKNDPKLQNITLVLGESLGKHAREQNLKNPIIISGLHPKVGDGWNPNLEEIGWSKLTEKNMFHFKGTLTSAINFSHALRPQNIIKLAGVDMNTNQYFFQDEYEKQKPLHDWTYELMKKSGKHSNILKEVGGYKQDYCIPWMKEQIQKTGADIFICNKNAYYAKMGLIKYLEIIT